MSDRSNLLFPEWQGYGAHQQVYHGAHQICSHLKKSLDFNEVNVPTDELLIDRQNILGKESHIKLLDQVSSLIKGIDPSALFMVGGTCACEIVPISFLNHKYDNDIAIFWFDAHGDLNTPETSPSHRLHGMPLRTLLGEGDSEILQRVHRIVTPQQVALVGTRDLDPGEKDYVANTNIPILKPVNSSHADELVDFAKTAGFTKAYIHLDLDVLEPQEFKHVLVPVANGLGVSNVISSMQKIRSNFELVGCSLVEYCPKDENADQELLPLISEGLGIEF